MYKPTGLQVLVEMDVPSHELSIPGSIRAGTSTNMSLAHPPTSTQAVIGSHVDNA
tara:strand:- start:346 stop:510 length:165 start_codon:yes stop_codon:yes gene_type:complete